MKRRSGFKNDCRGFTIIEVMAAIFIIAILGSITIAGFAVWMPGYRLKTAARDLYSNMQQVKMSAIKNNGTCTITFTSSPDQYVTTGVAKTVVLSDYGSGVRFQGPSGELTVASITFNSRGTCSSAGYAYLTNEKNSAYYRVGPLFTTGVLAFHKKGTGSWP